MTTIDRERLVKLVAALDGPGGEAAADALLGLEGALQHVALTFFQSTDPRRRAALLRCLGRFRSPAALYTLADGLAEPDEAVWRAAVPGIAALASIEARTVSESREADQARHVFESICAVPAAGGEDATKRRYLAEILDGLPPIRRRLLLFIEPTKRASRAPLIDTATRRMAAALRRATWSPRFWMGVHACVCGATSAAQDVILPRHDTNSLCLHYVAHHRAEVPLDQLQEVMDLGAGETQPTRDECAGRLTLAPDPETEGREEP